MTSKVSAELNRSLSFDQLKPLERASFSLRRPPVLVRLDKNFQLYKWTQYPLVGPTGKISSFWSPWTSLNAGGLQAPGYAELRTRYANRDGGVGRMQEFMRARNAVTQEWNNMQVISKAMIKLPVWGFLGICAPQHLSTALEAERLKTLPPGGKRPGEVLLIGGDFQLVIPNLTVDHIVKL